MAEEADLILLRAKWCRVIGNAVTVEKKSQNCLLNQLPTGQFIAEIAGLKTVHQDKIIATNKII